MKRLNHVIQFIAICTLLPACSSRTDETRHSFRIFVENGVTIAETNGGPKYEGELFEYEPILTLKGNPEIEESMLFRSGQFTVDRDGNFFICSENRIAVFDKEGSYVRSFGREGNGPGEFRRMRLQYLHDGIISIYDSRVRRTTHYQTNGELKDVVSPPPTISSNISELFCIPEGLIIISRTRAEEGTLTLYGMEIIHISADGDSVANFKTPLVPRQYRYGFEGGGGAGTIRYSGQPVAQCMPNIGLYITSGAEPEIQIYDFGGDLRRVIRLDIEPEPVTSEERSMIIQSVDDRVNAARESGAGIEPREASRRALFIPKLKAFWEDMQVDIAGYIWLQVPEIYNAASESRGRRYRVLSPEGEYLGDTRWPEWMSGRVVRDLLLSKQLNEETGEAIPTVYRISSAIRGFNYP